MITDNNSNADSELAYGTAIPQKNNSFKYLGHVVTLLYILGCFVCSQLVMYLDQARIAAYAIIPIIIIAKYLNDSGVSWTSSKKVYIFCLIIGSVWYLLVSWMTLVNIIPSTSIIGAR